MTTATKLDSGYHSGWFLWMDGRKEFLSIPPWLDGDAFACMLTDFSDVPVKFGGNDPHAYLEAS